MDGDTIMYIVWGVVLLGILISIFIAYWSRRHRAKRLQLMDLFSGYFRGDMPADQLGARARQIVSRHFMGSARILFAGCRGLSKRCRCQAGASAALRGATKEIIENVGGFEERVRADRSLPDRRMADRARIIRS